MNRTLPTLRRALAPALLVAALVATALPAAAADPMATATVYAGGVDFLPNVAYRGARVTVSGPEMDYERSFGAGDRLSVGVFDPEGQLLADGVYTWRLALTPTRRDARELKRAARRNGGEAPDAWHAQTGTFAIRNGLMVDSSLAEPRRARPSGPYSGLPTQLAAPARGDRVADDDDAATAAGRRPVARAVEATAPTGRTNLARSDDGAGQDPPTRALNEDAPTARRSYPTDGKNGRDQ